MSYYLYDYFLMLQALVQRDILFDIFIHCGKYFIIFFIQVFLMYVLFIKNIIYINFNLIIVYVFQILFLLRNPTLKQEMIFFMKTFDNLIKVCNDIQISIDSSVIKVFTYYDNIMSNFMY